MTISLTCRHCDATITADNEDDLVARVQAHVREHDDARVPSREHILARLHRQRHD